MTFALFYNLQDLTSMANQIQTALAGTVLSTADRRIANALWNGGLSGWNSSANLIGPTDVMCAGDVDCRRIVVTATSQGRILTRLDLANLCDVLATQDEYLHSIAEDVRANAVEPWPRP